MKYRNVDEEPKVTLPPTPGLESLARFLGVEGDTKALAETVEPASEPAKKRGQRKR